MIKKLLIFALAITAALKSEATLSGYYTINGALPASSTNYVTFEAAVSDLVNGTRTDGGTANGPGISATTIFDVASATYTLTNPLVIRSISGTSASNRVIFRSATGVASNVTVQYTSPSTALDAVIRIKGADNLMFERMTILNLSTNTTYSKGFHIDTAGTLSNTSDSIVIRGCILRTTWNLGSSVAVINSVNNNKNLRVVGCDIAKTSGIFFQGNTSVPYPSGLQIDSNNFTISGNDAFKPIYIRYAQAPLIRYNNINKSGCCADYYMDISDVKGQMVIAYNRIYGGSGGSGIYLNNVNSAVTDVTKAKFYNNFINNGTSSYFGLKINNCRYLDVFHNSFYLTNGTNSTAKAIELYNSSANGTKVSISNNIFYCNNSYAIHVSGSSATLARQMIDTLDYNLYFNNSTVPFAHFQGTNYSSLSSFKNAVYSTSGGNDANSYYRNPQYISTTDLHVAANNCFIGRPGLIGVDYDGNSRPTKCMMGADEPVRINNNIGVDAVIAPAVPFSTGTQDVKFVAMNYGLNNVTSFNAGYNVNNSSAQSQAITTSLNTCDTVHVLFTGAQQYNFGGGYQSLKCYTGSPNGTSDAYIPNDTLTMPVCQPLSGAYTINPAGSGSTNFTSFTLAAQSLNNCGISGPVTFSVSSGTYNEQVTLNPITGTSATNYVEFKSSTGNPANVNLTFNANSTNNFTLLINGASYVKFRNMTVTATNSSYGIAVSVRNNAVRDSFFNVTFTGVTTTSASNQSLSLIYSNSGVNSFWYFGNCRFNNSCHGIYFQSNGSAPSSENFTVTGSTFTNQYHYGIYASNLAGVRITNNTITTNSAYTAYHGVYAYWIIIPADINRPFITGNKISGGAGGHGIYCTYIGVNSTVTAARRALVANNFIQIGSGANGAYGLRDDNGNGVDFIHNSVHLTTSLASTAAAAANFTGTSYGGNTVLNNVFASTTGAAAIRIVNNTYYPTVNYNNLYSTGITGYMNATSYGNLGLWQGGSSRDANSISANPFFSSNTDLHSNQSAMNNAGQVSALVTTDIDGQSRCPNGGCPGGTSFPDIGADEFIPVALDGSVQAITSPAIICPGSGPVNVSVTLKNLGSTTLTSDSIGWSVNGVVQTPYYWTGSLAQGASAAGITVGTFSFSGASNVIRAWSYNPNAGTDGNPSNDTASFSPAASLNGTYTIGGTTPNYPDFTTAVNALNTIGICGPVTFNVRQGTYTERIQINAVSGSSAANTITFRPDPANSSAVVLTTSGNSSAADNHTIYLNGTKFITFRGLTITNTSSGTGSYGTVIRMQGMQDSVTFIKNTVQGPTTANTGTNFAVFNSPGGTSAADLIHRLSIDSNSISGGSYGIYLSGNSTAGNYENKARIRNNSITGYTIYGINAQYSRNTWILKNTISSTGTNTSAYCIYMGYTDTFRVENNLMNNLGQYGLYITYGNYQNNTGTAVSTIINNMIGGTASNASPSGIYLNTFTRYLNIYHNSVSVNGSGYGIFLQQTSLGQYTNLDIRNNSFANFGTGQAAYFYCSPAITNLTVNYNNYHSASTTKFTLLTSGYTTGTGGSPTYNANSKAGDPGYLNNLSNLHSISGQLADCGTNLGSVTTDIDGDNRPLSPSSTVDIGADEYNVPAYNIGVTAVTAPGCPLTAGLQDVTVTIKNFGTATVTSADVKYKVGKNGSVKTIAWTGSIATNATASVTFTGANQYNFTKLQIDSIIAWTEQPNANTDQYPANDTALRITYMPLNGTYTVGGSSPNFSNFTQVVAALNCEGVSGPVVFKVRNGTYTESISLGNIPGASSTNTITFLSESGSAAGVIWVAPTAAAYTVQLNNTKYITFRNMTVRNTNSPGNSFQLNGTGSDSCFRVTIQGCSMNNSWSGGNTNASIVSTGRSHELRILNNTLTWSFGISVIGNSTFSQYNRGLVIDSNNFTTTLGDVFTPFDIQYARTTMIRYNTVARAAGGGALTGNIRNISGAMQFTNNKVHGGGVYGVSFSNLNNNGETTPALIANNFFADNNTSSGCYALQIQNSNYVNVYNNSIYQHSNAATASALRTSATGTYSNVRIVNNSIVSNTSGTSSIPWIATGGTLAQAKGMIAESENNNYFVIGGASAPLFQLLGTNYTTVAAMQGAIYTAPANNDLSSMSANPGYVNVGSSANDQHITSSSPLLGKGKVIATVTRDIDQHGRSNPYDIGADQFDGQVRPIVGDFVGTCVNLSGSSWIDLKDSLGNIVFSINPNGNNLGSTCWGIRILNSTDGTTRTLPMPTSPNGLGYWLDRNGYITPTTQPTTPVSIRYYLLNTELADIRTYATAGGVNYETDSFKFLRDSMIITKFNGPVNNLDPEDGLSSSLVTGVPFGSISAYRTNAVYVQFNVSSFSEFTPTFLPSSVLVPLPVEFLHLRAEKSGNDVNLTWKVNGLEEIRHFEVERGWNGKDFTVIGKVAANNTATNGEFSYTDADAALAGENFGVYRIKAVTNNKDRYSEMRSVDFGRLETYQPYPNPFTDKLYLSLPKGLRLERPVSISVNDALGRKVLTRQITVNDETVEITFGEDLKPGVYFFNLELPSRTLITPVMKQ